MGAAKRPAVDDDCFITAVQPTKRARKTPPASKRVQQDVSDERKGQSAKQDSAQAKGGYDDQPREGRAKKPNPEEKRLKRWRKKAPQAWLEIRDRALTQRMFALDRKRDDTNPDHPTETISLAGTTGNVYRISIDNVPSCNCPHARKGNQCKHIAYVLSRVLRVKRKDLEYQLAFTSSELKEIFAQAPPLPSQTADDTKKDGNRKPIEGECPICVVDFEPASGEQIVYCKASCGNNIHAECFKMWKATNPVGRVTCPFCRTPWHDDDVDLRAAIGGTATRNDEGYINLASQLGLSGRRDYSRYNSYWMRQQLRHGNIGWDEDGAMEHDW